MASSLAFSKFADTCPPVLHHRYGKLRTGVLGFREGLDRDHGSGSRWLRQPRPIFTPAFARLSRSAIDR